jgi:hypothetical protein
LRGVKVNQIQDKLVRYYTKKVKKQIGKVVKDLPLLRNIKNLSSATFNLFYSPYSQYKRGGSVWDGMRNGVSGFFFSVTGESFNLITFVTSAVGNIFTGGSGDSNSDPMN